MSALGTLVLARFRFGLAAALAAFLSIGGYGVWRYADNFWLYRGFAAPHDPAFVQNVGTTTRFYVTSAALGGRRQPVDVYLPPGYATHPHRRYAVLYLLHGFPGRPGAFLQTVRAGVVEDVLLAAHVIRPLILVMPFGSTGSFTDKEWANGVRKNEAWATFVARDVVHAVDARYRTIARGGYRALGGLSEGGYGALNIGFHHPREFRVLESWSGYQRADRIASIFGKHPNGKLLADNSPNQLLPRVASSLIRNHVFVWFYSGSTDRLSKQNVAFAHELARFGVPSKFFLTHGGHNWALWRGSASRALIAASKHLAHA